MILPKSIELLKKLNSESIKPKLWIRDDDFCTATDNFHILVNNLSIKFDILFGAVPYRFKLSLLDKANFKRIRSNVYFCAHGFNHINNEKDKNKPPSEFPESRDIDEVKSEIQIGYNILNQSIGNRFLPIFIPPWNFIPINHLNILFKTGYKIISAGTDIKQPTTTNLAKLNTHLDVLHYEGDYPYSLKKLEKLDDELAALINNWQNNDTKEPIGILCHHTSMFRKGIFAFCNIVKELEPYFDPYKINHKGS